MRRRRRAPTASRRTARHTSRRPPGRGCTARTSCEDAARASAAEGVGYNGADRADADDSFLFVERGPSAVDERGGDDDDDERAAATRQIELVARDTYGDDPGITSRVMPRRTRRYQTPCPFLWIVDFCAL